MKTFKEIRVHKSQGSKTPVRRGDKTSGEQERIKQGNSSINEPSK